MNQKVQIATLKNRVYYIHERKVSSPEDFRFKQTELRIFFTDISLETIFHYLRNELNERKLSSIKACGQPF